MSFRDVYEKEVPPPTHKGDPKSPGEDQRRSEKRARAGVCRRQNAVNFLVRPAAGVQSSGSGLM